MDMNILDETFVYYVWLHTENVNVIIMNICTLRKNKKKQQKKRTEVYTHSEFNLFFQKILEKRKKRTENSKRTEEKCITSVFRL